jgi:phosphoribosylanthranilate isomerase
MTWVKICGVTTHEAIEVAADAGADAIGLVLAEGSPRVLTLHQARELAQDAPIATFIVTVDLTPGEALAAAEAVGVTGIQAHGIHSLDVAAEAADAGYLSIVPLAVGSEGLLGDLSEVPETSMLLFDTASLGAHGGTGIPFDWGVLRDPGRPFVLAGGLGPDNVAEAIDAVEPFGVDASSKLEYELGIKDLSRIVAFIEQAKQI